MPKKTFYCDDCEGTFELFIPAPVGKFNVKALAEKMREIEENHPPVCPECQKMSDKQIFEGMPFFTVDTDQIAAGRKAGLNVDRFKSVKDARDKKLKEDKTQSGAYWGADSSKLAKDIGLNKKQKVTGNNVVNVKK